MGEELPGIIFTATGSLAESEALSREAEGGWSGRPRGHSFIYLFLAALVLHCCAQAFSSCGEQGLLFVAVRGLLIAVASLVAEHGL